MALTFAETKELEELKQDHRIKIMNIQLALNIKEHDRKMARLDKQLKIAEVAGLTPETVPDKQIRGYNKLNQIH